MNGTAMAASPGHVPAASLGTQTARHDDAQRLARKLGWFSIALGATELVAARSLARWLGMNDGQAVLRTYGVREIGTGIGILAADEPSTWMWGRVVGDGLDLATLAPHLDGQNRRNSNVALAMAVVLGVTVADIVCAQALSRQNAERQRVQRRAVHDYSRRSGFPRSPEAMRGAAKDAEIPDDMRIPKALRPWNVD